MTATEILTQVIQILVGGITGIATGIGQGLSSLVTIIVFAGISLAIGLCRWVLQFLTSLGARDR